MLIPRAVAMPTTTQVLGLVSRARCRGAKTLTTNMADLLHDDIAADIRAWDAIGSHRTGTAGDRDVAAWLAQACRQSGVAAMPSEFPLRRWRPGRCAVVVEGRVAEGVPLFDGGTTGAQGVSAPLALLPCGPARIGVGVIGGGENAIAQARKEGRHPALVAITRASAAVPGLALQNADRFATPFGPPVLQVGSTHEAWLRAAAVEGKEATVQVEVDFEAASGVNVEARIDGRDPSLSPLVVITPKSSWWTSTAERGGGIALWLALLRRCAAEQPPRNMVFVATSGHELGHLGLAHFLRRNAELAASAHAWIHLGANFAARNSRLRLQASDDALFALARQALADANRPPADATPVGERPGGEARDIHDLGGRYVSFLGTNAWFHHVDDRWPETVDVAQTARAAQALFTIADALAGNRGHR